MQAKELGQGNAARHRFPVDRMRLRVIDLEQVNCSRKPHGMTNQLAAERGVLFEPAVPELLLDRKRCASPTLPGSLVIG